MGRITSYPNRPPFVVDQKSILRNQGRQIDWDLVSSQFGGAQKVQTNGAAARGATAITVDALANELFAGDVLEFGDVASVVVTVGVAGAAQGATSVPVAALSGPIPSGAVLDFGGAKFARLTAPAAAAATALTVAALPTALVSADSATYLGGKQSAVVSANTAAGATSVPVAALEFAIADNAVAYVTGPQGTDKFVLAGTVMAELSSGKVVPRAIRPGAETASMVIETDASQNSLSDASTGYGMITDGSVFENLLPDAVANGGTLPSAYKTELLAAGRWHFETYADSRS